VSTCCLRFVAWVERRQGLVKQSMLRMLQVWESTTHGQVVDGQVHYIAQMTRFQAAPSCSPSLPGRGFVQVGVCLCLNLSC
jgi:hypothetical protein